jgi:hypothetical protein
MRLDYSFLYCIEAAADGLSAVLNMSANSPGGVTVSHVLRSASRCASCACVAILGTLAVGL